MSDRGTSGRCGAGGDNSVSLPAAAANANASASSSSSPAAANASANASSSFSSSPAATHKCNNNNDNSPLRSLVRWLKGPNENYCDDDDDDETEEPGDDDRRQLLQGSRRRRQQPEEDQEQEAAPSSEEEEEEEEHESAAKEFEEYDDDGDEEEEEKERDDGDDISYSSSDDDASSASRKEKPSSSSSFDDDDDGSAIVPAVFAGTFAVRLSSDVEALGVTIDSDGDPEEVAWRCVVTDVTGGPEVFFEKGDRIMYVNDDTLRYGDLDDWIRAIGATSGQERTVSVEREPATGRDVPDDEIAADRGGKRCPAEAISNGIFGIKLPPGPLGIRVAPDVDGVCTVVDAGRSRIFCVDDQILNCDATRLEIQRGCQQSGGGIDNSCVVANVDEEEDQRIANYWLQLLEGQQQPTPGKDEATQQQRTAAMKRVVTVFRPTKYKPGEIEELKRLDALNVAKAAAERAATAKANEENNSSSNNDSSDGVPRVAETTLALEAMQKQPLHDDLKFKEGVQLSGQKRSRDPVGEGEKLAATKSDANKKFVPRPIPAGAQLFDSSSSDSDSSIEVLRVVPAKKNKPAAEPDAAKAPSSEPAAPASAVAAATDIQKLNGPVPALCQSTVQWMQATPSYTPAVQSPIPTANSQPQSESKYSAARVQERTTRDGMVAPVSEPKKTKDGLYLRPVGRARKGMNWDAVWGIWVPAPK